MSEYLVGVLCGFLFAMALIASSAISYGQVKGRCLQAAFDKSGCKKIEVTQGDVCWCVGIDTKTVVDISATNEIAP